jgi:hypothetical protein
MAEGSALSHATHAICSAVQGPEIDYAFPERKESSCRCLLYADAACFPYMTMHPRDDRISLFVKDLLINGEKVHHPEKAIHKACDFILSHRELWDVETLPTQTSEPERSLLTKRPKLNNHMCLLCGMSNLESSCKLDPRETLLILANSKGAFKKVLGVIVFKGAYQVIVRLNL